MRRQSEWPPSTTLQNLWGWDPDSYNSFKNSPGDSSVQPHLNTSRSLWFSSMPKVEKPQHAGQIWPAVCFCAVQDLITIIIFLNNWKNKRRIFHDVKVIWNSNFNVDVSCFIGSWPRPCIYVLAVDSCFRTALAELSGCSRDYRPHHPSPKHLLYSPWWKKFAWNTPHTLN